ncbi:DHA2 family efflux MFS transporter permease subunit [Aeromicrobium wangtongii]|uniref:DHA2 family efflux MFS transporter permease subunit n=1 Tax=Aeromicrobium wangtongii TaxID=2969247 RepID=A0ABY5M7K3_9ACTN|nr:DHA2 family efflux MFS transporter permease subunit [Aeromicrobium wangtongii]MCD9198902.1 DHA2 family efflux MFS transporter permease subunit [Aeromicrobium wangtongii]UUP13059.1 DHA2 family efflux MFS transporter permease subunit [Aeromicrobium wangtongii]
MASTSAVSTELPPDYRPWPALWAMVIGFFMILVDNTIVSVATPAIRDDLRTDYNSVIWVTSAYLLAYAVPLLVTGRLGDRFGPKNIYLVGLAIFTLASLWCGLTDSIEMLIVARVVQGFGAALITPQTMAVITRTFAPANRGAAMALWGATAGVATLVGPILGGVLVDSLGWEWIFIINVPVGIIGFVLAVRLVPALPTHTHTFDWLGVVLSGVGVFLVVFGIQEGEKYDWGRITGLVSVPLLIALGVIVFAAFIWWQARIKAEPLVPLGLFRDRNFSLGNGGIALVSLAITAMSLPFFFYAQGVRGWSPTESALLMAPMAVMLMVLSPFVGKLVDRIHPRNITIVGFGTAAIAMTWLSQLIAPDTPVWQLCLPMALFGISNACLWAPLSATTTRNLPMASAGSGAGVFNTTRQIGAVLGSAAIAALIQARLTAHGLEGATEAGQGSGPMPAPVQTAFSEAMGQTLYLPVAAFVVGLVLVLFLARPTHARPGS